MCWNQSPSLLLVNPISPQPISSIIFCIEFLCSEAKNVVLSKQVIICSWKELLYKTAGNNNAGRPGLANNCPAALLLLNKQQADRQGGRPQTNID